jgi:hypothetical protein
MSAPQYEPCEHRRCSDPDGFFTRPCPVCADLSKTTPSIGLCVLVALVAVVVVSLVGRL